MQSYDRSTISIHALREEGDLAVLLMDVLGLVISIHALREEGDLPQWSLNRLFIFISIHALREEGDYIFHAGGQAGKISIHALREEGDSYVGSEWGLRNISIHALREEGDLAAFRLPAQTSYFYPRPPRGGRLLGQRFRLKLKKFLATPSARRATLLYLRVRR